MELEMALEKMLTYEEVSAMLCYDPDTGVIVRTSRTGRQPVGSVAGHFDGNGYLRLAIKGSTYSATRVAWLLMTGEWPSSLFVIDHINRDTTDNRWVNLRLATISENGANAKMRCDNKSGFKGVSWGADRGKWRAHIQINSKVIQLGCYETAEEAVEAYQAAAEKYFGDFVVAA
jgi:hypothetical protein